MRWLFKTEPGEYSFERLVRDGKTRWTGVKNALALRHLGQVKKGDLVAIYHTGKVKAVVGIARALADAAGGSVPIAPVRAVGPVGLATLKADRRLEDFPLVTFGRLSVMPVPEELWPVVTGSSA